MFWPGLVLLGLAGVAFGAIFASVINLPQENSMAVIIGGMATAPAMAAIGLVLLVESRRPRVDLRDERPHTAESALAKIESVRAASGEGPYVTLSLDLTVAPAAHPSYRVETYASVNIADVVEFRAGRTVLVDFEAEKPWRVSVHANPGAEWAGRIALARLESASPDTRVRRPKVSPGSEGITAYIRKNHWKAGAVSVVIGAVFSLFFSLLI